MTVTIVPCPSCEGFGWFEDEDGAAQDCDWCAGIGYIYRDTDGLDKRIPPADYGLVSDQLEQLETQRLRAMGYTGEAKKPWEQKIRQQRDEGDE
ncbi:MAG: hypothetical protein H0X30_20045 [Anaerolineae bacterium]|nr:hypothetical protein [Anaerolineae bacterium]